MTTKLVLIRHGQSIWNQENRFTGWKDVDLTEQGQSEARRAGTLLNEADLDFDQVYTSVLKRAIRTMWTVVDVMDRMWLPVTRHWRLNERHYGALQGLDKSETAAKYGEDQVHLWRRGYDTPPPAMERDDERYAGHQRVYQENLNPEDIPLTESLQDTVARFVPYFEDTIAPQIRDGQRILIVAHGNSLRALVKHLDQVPDDEITGLNIPTGIPLVYELDDQLKPERSYYLGDSDEAEAAAAAVGQQGKQ